MEFLNRYKSEIVILAILTVVFFILRLPNLTLQPIFADEAIYIRWAQVMRSEPTLRFLPMSDGKTPLFMWTMIPFFKFLEDPLFAGRFLSVISGLFTLLGVYFLSKKVFTQKVAFWAGLLYVITPYTVFFDRMALVDSMLSAFTIWAVYFAIWLLGSLRLDLAMILGYLLGGTILVKTPGLLNLLILPISIIGLKKGKERFIKLFIFWAVAIGLALVIYNLLRLGPEFHQLSARNADYVFSPMELSGRPLDPFIPHLRDILDWFPDLLTWPILLVSVVGVFYIFLPLNRLGLIIFLWAIVPLLLNMAFLKTFTARYLLTSIPLILILAGFGITKLLPHLAYAKRFPVILMLIVILPLALYFDYILLTNPQSAPLPRVERKGYFEDWTAGYAFQEIADYLKEERKNGKVVVATEGFFGTLPDGLFIYLDKADIAIIGSFATISAQIRDAAGEKPTYFVGNKNSLKGALENVVLLKEFSKAIPLEGSEQDATVLYRVLPN